MITRMKALCSSPVRLVATIVLFVFASTTLYVGTSVYASTFSSHFTSSMPDPSVHSRLPISHQIIGSSADGSARRPRIAVAYVQPLAAKSRSKPQLSLSSVRDVVQQSAPTDTPTSTVLPTQQGIHQLDNGTPVYPSSVTPFVPASTPTVYVTDVDGRFFYGASHIFGVTTATPPAFTKQFPEINFNPYGGFTCGDVSIGPNTLPLTNAKEEMPCQFIPAQVTIVAPPPTPTMLSAGVDPLRGFQAVFYSTIYVSTPADISFHLYNDDGFVWGVGPLNGVQGAAQPSYVTGTFDPPAPPPPAPWPATNFGD